MSGKMEERERDDFGFGNKRRKNEIGSKGFATKKKRGFKLTKMGKLHKGL